MWNQSKVSNLLGIRLPVIQGGMAGGITTPELVAEVCNAGGLGTLGAGYMNAEQIGTAIRAIRSRTNRPFAVNLFAPENPKVSDAALAKADLCLDRIRHQLGIPVAHVTRYAESFSEQINAVLEARVPVLSFTFGILSSETMEALKQVGTVLIGTATTVREALALEQAGVHMVVAQGAEAGGHRGTFACEFEAAMVGTMALIPQIVDCVRIPVVAAGGIGDGRGVVASFALGAAGVQLGTAFLTCSESGAHPMYQQAVLQSTDESTRITRAFSGKPARGIRNTFTEEMAPYESLILPYPVQNALTRDIRQAGAKQGKSEWMSLWAGQASPLARVETVASLMERLDKEVMETLHMFRALEETDLG